LAFIGLLDDLAERSLFETEVNDMCHWLHRLSQLSGDSNVVVPTNTSTKFPKTSSRTAARRWQSLPIILTVMTAVLLLPSIAFAQGSPWERAASNLEFTFTGPLARSLALVSIVIGGLMFMFGEGGAKRQISGIVFGGGLALFATQFMTWLF
jgi:type IV secretory pathway VirB2 component (pilin)